MVDQDYRIELVQVWRRLATYADLRVLEVWVYDGTTLSLQQLQNQDYVTASSSQFFPNLPIAEIAGFLQQDETVDYLELVKTFRAWVKGQIKSQAG